jgi:hypothetical protein
MHVCLSMMRFRVDGTQIFKRRRVHVSVLSSLDPMIANCMWELWAGVVLPVGHTDIRRWNLLHFNGNDFEVRIKIASALLHAAARTFDLCTEKHH